MFVLQPKPTFEVDVEILTLDGSDAKITFEFIHKGRKEVALFVGNLKPDANDTEMLLGLVKGWKGVDVKFTPEAFDTLLDNYPNTATRIFNAYLTALSEGVQKNSQK